MKRHPQNLNAPEPSLIFSEPKFSHAHQQEYPKEQNNSLVSIILIQQTSQLILTNTVSKAYYIVNRLIFWPTP